MCPMQEKLLIDIGRIEPDGADFDGEVDIIDIDEEFVHPFGGVRYNLHAQLFSNELLLRGHLEQDFDLVCSRCGKDFDTTIKVDDWVVSFEVDQNTLEVDASEEARSAILLELPNYPVCSDSCVATEGTFGAAAPSSALAAALEEFEKNQPKK